MTNVNKTNRFFNEHVYSNLAYFAISPVNWALNPVTTGIVQHPDYRKVILAALLAPVLIPATIATLGLALCLAGIAAFFHVLSLAGAGIADGCSNQDNRLTHSI